MRKISKNIVNGPLSFLNHNYILLQKFNFSTYLKIDTKLASGCRLWKMAKKSPFKSFSSILFAVFGSILFHSFGTSWLFIVRFKFIMVSAIKAPPISDWPYFRRICGMRYLFTNSLLPWRNKKGNHHLLIPLETRTLFQKG